jgi:hypothetical protein
MSKHLLIATCSACLALVSCAAHVQSFSFVGAHGHAVGLTENPRVNPDKDGMLMPGTSSGPRYSLSSAVRVTGKGMSFFLEYQGEEPGARLAVYGAGGKVISRADLPDLPDMQDVVLKMPLESGTKITGFQLFAPTLKSNSGISAAGFPISGIQISSCGIAPAKHAFYSNNGVGIVSDTGSATPGSAGASVQLEKGVMLSHDGREIRFHLDSSVDMPKGALLELGYRYVGRVNRRHARVVVVLHGAGGSESQSATEVIPPRTGNHTIVFNSNSLGFTPRQLSVQPGNTDFHLTRLDILPAG